MKTIRNVLLAVAILSCAATQVSGGTDFSCMGPKNVLNLRNNELTNKGLQTILQKVINSGRADLIKKIDVSFNEYLTRLPLVCAFVNLEKLYTFGSDSIILPEELGNLKKLKKIAISCNCVLPRSLQIRSENDSLTVSRPFIDADF